MENTQVDNKQIEQNFVQVEIDLIEKHIKKTREVVEKLQGRLDMYKEELKKNKLRYIELRVEQHRLRTEK